MIIAVDGPAASGKGTIARALGAHYGLPVLDTGKLYRAVGLAVSRAGGNPDDEAEAVHACAFDDALLGDPALMSEQTGALASRVSIHPAVRAALLQRQRDFAGQPGGAVLDGRDIGTVIAPHAHAKLYIVATVEARAERRRRELAARGEAPAIDDLIRDIAARDARDSGRASAPLARAPDAALLDTSEIGIESAVRQAIALVDAQLESAR